VIRILLGQRGLLLCGALAAMLSQEEDLQVVAQLADAREVLPAAQRVRPDLAVLDCTLPGTVAIDELCRGLFATVPDCGALVILDLQASAGLGTDLARLAPRVGLIATDASPTDLIDAVRQLSRGEPVLDVEVVVAALTAEENPFTGREREVLRLAVDGAPSKEIAKRLALSTGTVRNHLSRVVAKTGGRTRIEAIRIAQDAGWI
jgi:two-component system response regulator DesR